MTRRSDDRDVLIVGAGPVGLLLAIELHIAGVRARVISRRIPETVHSKATILWPRILELLTRSGLTPLIMRHGHCFDEMNYYSNKKRIGRMSLRSLDSTAFNFAITIPQWRTERIFAEEAARRGIEVEYGVEYVSADQDAAGVDVTTRDAAGGEESRRYAWVVGADGFRSRLRDSLAFGFQGFEMETRLAITDTEMLTDTIGSELAYFLHRSGNMVLAPLGAGIFRIGASVPKGMEVGSQPDRAFFEALLAERVPGKHRIGEMRFSGIFSAHVRTAGTFQLNRVFLVGDAAHAMSPSGAQGLNTGLQDAVNLGWKLGGVVRGRFPRSILESYTSERLASVRRVTDLSTTLARMSLYRSKPKIMVRDAALRVSSFTGHLDRFLSHRVSQMDSDTRAEARSASTGRLAGGQRIALGWTDGAYSPALSLTAFTVLLWPGTSYTYSHWCAFVGQVREACPSAEVIDLGGRPTGYLGRALPEGSLCICVRPDGHIEAVVPLPAGGASPIEAISSHVPTSNPTGNSRDAPPRIPVLATDEGLNP